MFDVNWLHYHISNVCDFSIRVDCTRYSSYWKSSISPTAPESRTRVRLERERESSKLELKLDESYGDKNKVRECYSTGSQLEQCRQAQAELGQSCREFRTVQIGLVSNDEVECKFQDVSGMLISHHTTQVSGKIT